MASGFTVCMTYHLPLLRVACILCTVPSCPHLVLKVWVGPNSQEKLNHLLMAIEASSFKRCPTILYSRMGYSNHKRWLHMNWSACLCTVTRAWANFTLKSWSEPLPYTIVPQITTQEWSSLSKGGRGECSFKFFYHGRVPMYAYSNWIQ